MAITLDATTEQRIQRQLEGSAFRKPAELLALELVEPEAAQDDWLRRNKRAINASLDRTFVQAERGEGYSPEESCTLLAQHRSSRTA